MNVIDAFIFGIVEGLTEFLPISSTAHLILTSRILGIPSTDFTKTFEIAIQLGAIGAVVVLYRKQLMDIKICRTLFAAFVPTAVIGLFLYKLIKNNFMDNRPLILGALFFGGLILIIFEYFYGKNNKIRSSSGLAITVRQAVLIGIFQALAMIPGVSRAGATIVGGLLLGIHRKTIVEFSFLLAVPTMSAATALDLFKNAGAFTAAQAGNLCLGFVVAFFVALWSIKFLLTFIKTNNFVVFGIYRIIAAVVFWKLTN